MALGFNGSSDSVSFGNVLDAPSKMTISVWARPTGTFNNTNYAFKPIVCKLPSADNPGFIVEHGSSDFGVTVSYTAIMCAFRAASDSAFAVTPAGVISGSVWNHILVVFDGSASGNANRLKIWINGVAQTLSFSGTIGSAVGSNSETLQLGSQTSKSYYWQGEIGDFFIVSGSALTDDGFTQSISRKFAKGFDHAPGIIAPLYNDATDWSGNSRNGSLTGTSVVAHPYSSRPFDGANWWPGAFTGTSPPPPPPSTYIGARYQMIGAQQFSGGRAA